MIDHPETKIDNDTLINMVNFVENDVKSLSANLLAIMSKSGVLNPAKKCWDLSVMIKRETSGKFNIDFVKKRLVEFLEYNESSDIIAVTEPQPDVQQPKSQPLELTSKAKQVIKSSTITKNEKVRILMDMNYSISQIAVWLESSYQRIKNVKKAIDRKKEADRIKKEKEQ